MSNNLLNHRQLNDLPLSVLVLLILLLYTYGIWFKVPYSGFSFNNGTGQIVEITAHPEIGLFLQTGDILVKIGDIYWTDYKKDSRLSFFENTKTGDIVDIIVLRNGVELAIPWKFPGFNLTDFNGRFFNIWFLAYIFWFFGAAVQLLIRPRNGIWWLFVTANYLTALWLIFGSMSASHVWESSILLHAVTWLMLPVYLHLHWVFPRPLVELPKTVWIFFYAVCFSLAAAEIIQALPRNLYAFAFLITLLGSILLEAAHFIQHIDQRNDVTRLAISTLIAFIPSIVFGALIAVGATPYIGPAALFSLPFMPLAYSYIIYRRQLGGLEVRVNRFISLYLFMILFGTALSIIIVPLASLTIDPETWIFLGILLIMSTAVAVVIVFPPFQTFVEKRFLGIKFPYQNLQETYSNRIAATSTNDLLQLLESEFFPSLLIRQFAFLQVFNGKLKTLLTRNISPEQLPHEKDINVLISQTGRYLPYLSPDSGWIRLILPLKVGDSFIGFWLLGQRDPDDHYSQSEIPILQSIANQTAVALSNILHAEQVRKLFQLDVERYEQERLSLARDLHDSVLNQLAALRNNLGEAIPPTFQSDYEELTHRLREIVSDLRPPMLIYGLKPAIEELADNLMERISDKVQIKVDIEASEERIPPLMEQHLFRIVQEACENSIRHANAKSIFIYGSLTPEKVDLNIQDDGNGFDADTKLEFDNLLSNHHFGLSGMTERAYLIGALIKIHSSQYTGTRIHLMWNNSTEATQ